MDFFFFEPDRLVRDLNEAGFTVDEREDRDPYPGVEAETRRLYIVATP